MTAATPASRRMATLVLVGGMLSCGAMNSLWSKWQDMQCVANCDTSHPHLFEQPVWQTANMFLGEFMCLVAFSLINSSLNPFRLAKSRRQAASAAQRARIQAQESSRLANPPLSRPEESAFNFGESAISLRQEQVAAYDSAAADPKAQQDQEEQQATKASFRKSLLFWTPATCDITATTLMNVGLLFVPVSIYQMLRGALVLWVGVFSVIFLKRRLHRAEWAALATVMIGVAIVGLSSLVGPAAAAPPSSSTSAASSTTEDASAAATERDPLLGIFMILGAQIFTASQFVIEEKIMERYSVEPMLAVGYEGGWGLLTTLVAMPFLYAYVGSRPEQRHGYFDIPEGWHQIIDNPTVWGSSIAIAVSIAFFNFCGLAVTKTISATARSTIDTSRTCLIWLVSLALGWEHFRWLQVIGFALLVYGTFVFNGISRFPRWLHLHPVDPPIVLPDEGPISPRASSVDGQDSDDEDDNMDHEAYERMAKSNESVGRSRSVERYLSTASSARRFQHDNRKAAQEDSPLLQ